MTTKTVSNLLSFTLAFAFAFLAGARGLALSRAPVPEASDPQVLEEICWSREGRPGSLDEFLSDEGLREVIAETHAWLHGEVPGEWSLERLANHLDAVFGGTTLEQDPQFRYEEWKDSTCEYHLICKSLAQIQIEVASGEDPVVIQVVRWMYAG